MVSDAVDGLVGAMLPAWAGLAGRRALVTGASMSIGRAIACGLARSGASVAIQYSSAADLAVGAPDAAKTTLLELQQHGQAIAIDASFGRDGEAERVVAECSRALGGVDVLVACASVQRRQDFFSISRDEILQDVKVNFLTTIELLQRTLPGMVERGWGRVVTIGSLNETRPDPDLAIYAALKSAQHTLGMAIGRKFAPSGVVVNSISPGLIATVRNKWRRADQREWERIERSENPMQHAGVPSDIVGLALLLCSDAARFITGSDFQINGGAHLV